VVCECRAAMLVHASFPTCNSLLRDKPTNILCDARSHAHAHAHAHALVNAHACAHAITQLMEVHEHAARLTGMRELSLTNNTIRKISESVCGSLTRCPPLTQTHNTHARTHARTHACALARARTHGHTWQLYTYTHARLKGNHAEAYACTPYSFVCVCARVCVCVRACVCVCVCVCACV